MRFIDKSRHREAFDAYTRDYLHESESGQEFIPNLESDTSYINFSQKRWKYLPLEPEIPFKGWLQILQEEGADMCCYCMRRLSQSDISVEHLIPENFTGLDEAEEVTFYGHHAPYLHDYVITGREFDALAAQGAADIDTRQQMPHLIAHGNLFLACNAEVGCMCNNHRGNARILPMMLMDDVAQWTKYLPSGEFQILHPNPEAAITVVRNLELNTPTLQRIRRLWYLLSRKGICPDANREYAIPERDNILRQAFDITDETTVLPQGYTEFVEDYYWNLLLKYNWFYAYYLSSYPI